MDLFDPIFKQGGVEHQYQASGQQNGLVAEEVVASLQVLLCAFQLTFAGHDNFLSKMDPAKFSNPVGFEFWKLKDIVEQRAQ